MAHPRFRLTITSPTTVDLVRDPHEVQKNPRLNNASLKLTLQRFYGGLLWFAFEDLAGDQFRPLSPAGQRGFAVRATVFEPEVTVLDGASTGQVVFNTDLVGQEKSIWPTMVGLNATNFLTGVGLITREEENYLDSDGQSVDMTSDWPRLLARAMLAGIEIIPINEKPDIWSTPVLTGFSIRLMNSSDHLLVGVADGLPQFDLKAYRQISADLARSQK